MIQTLTFSHSSKGAPLNSVRLSPAFGEYRTESSLESHESEYDSSPDSSTSSGQVLESGSSINRSVKVIHCIGDSSRK